MCFRSGARLGEWKISTEIDCVQNLAIEDCADPVLDVDVSETIPHPYYSGRNGNNDVGLVRLEKIVNFTGTKLLKNNNLRGGNKAKILLSFRFYQTNMPPTYGFTNAACWNNYDSLWMGCYRKW